jgi:hypothetical protein
LSGHAEQRGVVLRKEADFLEAGAVDQPVDALAGSQLARLVLLLDAFFAAAFHQARAFLV